MTTFVEYAKQIWPRWLSRKWGGRFRDSLMLVADSYIEAAIEATLAKSPLRGPEDALTMSGDDRGLPRYPNETTPIYRARLRDPWTPYGLDGTGKGIETQFRAAGLPTAVVLPNWKFSLDGKNDAATWGRYWVFVPPGSGFTATDGYWDDGGTYDGTIGWGGIEPQAQLDTIRAIVTQWEGAHALFLGIIVVISGEVWDYPASVWDDGSTWDESPADIAYLPADEPDDGTW